MRQWRTCLAVLLALAAGFAAKPPASGHTIRINGILIDKYCAEIAIASHDGYLPVVHQQACMILEDPCVKEGYGVIKGNQFYPFGTASNRRMIAAVRQLKRANDLAIAITGVWNGKTLRVISYHWL